MTRIVAVVAVLLLSTPAWAQWLKYPTPGMPRKADGTPDLTAAAPRTADGRPDLSGTWRMGPGRHRLNITTDLPREDVLPWAQAASKRSLDSLGADRAGDLCLPAGPAIAYRSTLFKIVQTPGLTLVLYEADGNYVRQIFSDGRALPTDPNPSWLGYSIGRWDGDVLVVETIGFNGKSRLDGFGHPYTEALRMTERYRRRDFGRIDLEITYDDPGAYKRPFTVTQTLQFQPDNEILESVCAENERDAPRLVGRTRPPATVAPAVLAQYAGTYEIGPGRLIVVTVVEGQLWVEQGGNGPVPLNAESDTTFMLELGALGPPTRFDFFKNATGEVTHLTWERPAGTVTARRVHRTARTPWGDPDLQGAFSNENERLIPMERPDRFAGRRREEITPGELASFAQELNAAAANRPEGRAFGGVSPQRFDLTPSRAWFVVDPADGRMPPLTPHGAARQAGYRARTAQTPAAAQDSNLWYRCISVGLPRSMMPSPDGAPFRIVQAPGVVAIQYERMHEARVIPLEGRPHLRSTMTAYMGDARGRWDGDTLVVETLNFKGQFQMTSAAADDLRIVERFTPLPSGSLDWSVTIDAPSGWTRPWTFSIPLTKVDERHGPLEDACHEGNYVLRNILSAARAEENR